MLGHWQLGLAKTLMTALRYGKASICAGVM
jgi:hypothetical protein